MNALRTFGNVTPPGATGREAALLEAARLIGNLMRCVAWLLRHDLHITGFSAWRGNGIDRVSVRVAAHPRLHILFGHDGCAWRQRRQEGALTIYTWFGERFGCRVEWEETCAN